MRNIIDFVVIGVSLLAMLQDSGSNLAALRIFRLFDALSNVSDFRILYLAIGSSLIKAFWLFVVLVVLMSMYSIFGNIAAKNLLYFYRISLTKNFKILLYFEQNIYIIKMYQGN